MGWQIGENDKIMGAGGCQLGDLWRHLQNRLCMMQLGQENIRDVILFPQLKPK